MACAHDTQTRADGVIVNTTTCEARPGDVGKTTVQATATGTADDVHSQIEIRRGSGPSAGEVTRFQSHMTYLGDCPEGVKAGQMITAKGEIPTIRIGRLLKVPKSAFDQLIRSATRKSTAA